MNAHLIQGGNAETFGQELEELLACTRGPLILDMTATTFIGSSGIGMMANAIRITRDQDRLFHVVTPRRTVRQVFRMIRFTDFPHFHVSDTVEETFSKIAKSAPPTRVL